MPEVQDVLVSSINKDPLSFADNLKSVLGQRAAEAIEDMKMQLSANLYGDQEPVSSEEDPHDESDDSFDDDPDFDDIDIGDFEDANDISHHEE